MYDFGLKVGESCEVYSAWNIDNYPNLRESHITCLDVQKDENSGFDKMLVQESLEGIDCGTFVWYKGLSSDLGLLWNNGCGVDGIGRILMEVSYNGEVIYSNNTTSVENVATGGLKTSVSGKNVTVTNIGKPERVKLFSADSNILGANQLDNLIEQDETISAELNSLNVTGVKISKEMKIIPINNTLLYIETIYQTKTNEINQPITLEKVIVASGTKVAIGDNLENALSKLLSQSAVNLEVNNTEDIEGLIDTIIKANNNLTDSNSRNDWEMMGSDIKTLQELIERLDKMRQENNKKTTATNTQSTQSTETK